MAKVEYLEIVTTDLDGQRKTMEQNLGVSFEGPVAELGNAYVADLNGGGRVGLRAPMHESEEPVTRPYFLCEDIDAAVKNAEAAGAMIMHPPMEIPGQGKFAIYMLGGVQQALWQN